MLTFLLMVPAHDAMRKKFRNINKLESDAVALMMGDHYDVWPLQDETMRHDPLTKEQRSERMSRIRGADTKPEMAVRRLVHGMGFRYRLHAKDLPGHPNLVFRPRKKVIFIHGCFWHQHGCSQYRMPKSKEEFWLPKLKKNVERDKYVYMQLEKLRWRYLIIGSG